MFLLGQYLGKWFEQERYFTFYEEVGRCWQGEYFIDYETGGLSAKLTFNDVLLNKPTDIVIDVFAKDPYYAPNRLTYTIRGVPFFEDNYEVLATDYETFTIEYACKNIPFLGHITFAWILTRSPHPTIDVIWRAKSAMNYLDIDTSLLQRTPQTCY
ncbi:UNVERIFIED_CONTAM: hypothetical protein GTU68_054739 [Idotea baltica]|nr:hypothetical protein [Idotea baltica]